MIAEDMLTQAQQRCIPDVSFELIPIRNLVSNQEYQRPLSEIISVRHWKNLTSTRSTRSR